MGEFFGHLSFAMVRTEFLPRYSLSIPFIYVMRNTAVFFCTRIVQIPVPRTVSIPFFGFEWSPEWESPDLMFHRTVLLFFGDFIIPHFLALVNMASYQKYAFAFYAKGRNCVTLLNSPFTNAKKCDILNNGGSRDRCLIRLLFCQNQERGKSRKYSWFFRAGML